MLYSKRQMEPRTAATRRVDPDVRHGDLAAPPPPLLSGAPLVGNLPEFLRDPYGMFIRGYRSLGPVFLVRFMSRRMVVLSGAEGLRFLSKQGRELLCSKPVWDDFVGLFGGERALVNADGDFHAELRKRLRPSMSRSTLEKRVPEVREVVERCLRRWDGQTVDVERFTRDLVFHQLAALMDMAGVDPDEYYEDLLRVMHTSIEVTAARRWPRVLLWDPRFRRAKRRITKMGIDLFRTVGESNPEDGLFPILRRCVKDGLLREQDIPLLAITPYFAGIDTVAATLSFVLSAVYRRPVLQTELLDEVKAANVTSSSGRDWLAQLNLAEAVKLEVTRRYPVTLTMVRYARAPFVYAGHQISEDDQLLISVGANGLMQEYFDDPDTFDPGRFLGPDPVKPEPGALNPYGMGPHTCLGAALADVQIIATLALLIEQADIELLDSDRPLEMKYSPYPLPKGDRLRIRLRR